MGKLRVTPPVRSGGPKEPEKPAGGRVSTIRQGVMATKTKAPAGIESVITVEVTNVSALLPRFHLAARSSSAVGWKYKGADQALSGRLSLRRCAAKPFWASALIDVESMNIARAT